MTGESHPMAEAAEIEQTYEVTITKLGTLGDLIGDSAIGKIESSLDGEEIDKVNEAVKRCFSDVEDHDHLACIDGRRVEQNVDGTPYFVRLHQAGADFAAPVTAILGGSASLPSRQEGENTITSVYNAAKLANSLCGIERASHTGGCGAANLAPKHLEAISDPKIQAITKAVLQVNTEFLNLNDADIDNTLRLVAERAYALGSGLISDGWDGNEFTNRAVEKNSIGVEVLETADDATHGHHESQIAIVVDSHGRTIDERKLTENRLPDVFVVDLYASKRISQQLASARGQEGYIEAVVANVAWHIAVASVLCGKNMPVNQFNIQ